VQMRCSDGRAISCERWAQQVSPFPDCVNGTSRVCDARMLQGTTVLCMS
jgi:hypothetical protein